MVNRLMNEKFLPDFISYGAAFYLCKAESMFLHQKLLEKYLKDQPTSKIANLVKEMIFDNEKEIKFYIKTLEPYQADL